MRRIVLASASPSRKQFFEQHLRLPFTVDPSAYEEDLTLQMPPHELVQHLAAGKAREVADRHDDALVIGADTIAYANGAVLGKPKDEADARRMLGLLSGASILSITGFAVIDTRSGEEILDSEETTVHFRTLDREDIEAYVASREPFGKAGAFEILARGWYLVDRIEGDVFTVAGLPLARLAHRLKDFGVNVLTV